MYITTLYLDAKYTIYIYIYVYMYICIYIYIYIYLNTLPYCWVQNRCVIAVKEKCLI